MAPRFTVRSTTAADWQEVRALRLQALADTPIAFGETLAAGRRRDEASWRERGGRGQLEHSTFLAAIDADGTWVGTMGGVVEGTSAAPQPMLVGVFVAPSHRGRRIGVADALLAGIEDWAATEGDSITLDVHEDNDRAIAFYESRSYTRTGRTHPYPLAQGSRELEMRKAL